ncbi:ATP-binding cassette domain-containing protein [Soehngenia saccharolytica]|nr:ATP-binding cassette domain-containing protein [Soehngenia saccharolytica]
MPKIKDGKKVLIRVENLKQYFPVKKGSIFNPEHLFVRANDDVTLDIYEGETFGLVGESGCGKSTLGRTLLQLYEQTDGRTLYYGRSIDDITPKYVLEVYKNLDKEVKELHQLRHRENEDKENYEKLTDGNEKYKALEKYRESEKKARNKYLDIVELVGGFLVADDFTEISKVLTSQYEVKIQAKEIRDEIRKLQIESTELKNKGKSSDSQNSKIEELRKELEKKEKAIADFELEVEKLKDKYNSHPDFEKYESKKDDGINLAKLEEEEMRRLRKDLQLIFQDPYSSLNPRLTVGQIISEGLYAHNMFPKNSEETQKYILSTMEKCGLAPYFVHRYPHQFSGGQRQRIGIARSVALDPKFIVCDEAVSALDVSIQSQIINLLIDLKEQENLTYMFISHDLSVIRYISDRVGVMYLGNIVELADTEEIFENMMHPYTQALLSAIPTTDPEGTKIEVLEGDIPSPIKPPTGCKFHTRCKYATEICSQVQPQFEEARPGHFVACHHKLNEQNKEMM